MKVLIVGVNHQIQPTRILGMSPDGSVEAFERAQKEAFGAWVRKTIQDRGVTFIGEEAEHGAESIAGRVANQEGRQWANIEMSPQMRQERQIPPDYKDNPKYSDEQRAAWNSERERYMVEQAMAHSPRAQSALILCGGAHTGALAKLFRDNGHDVETYDIIHEPWYVEDWLEHLLNS
jgi:phosphoribosylformylglycinamidine (FGAM) synthase-like amidotransferase family enzyme